MIDHAVSDRDRLKGELDAAVVALTKISSFNGSLTCRCNEILGIVKNFIESGRSK